MRWRCRESDLGPGRRLQPPHPPRAGGWGGAAPPKEPPELVPRAAAPRLGPCTVGSGARAMSPGYGSSHLNGAGPGTDTHWLPERPSPRAPRGKGLLSGTRGFPRPERDVQAVGCTGWAGGAAPVPFAPTSLGQQGCLTSAFQSCLSSVALAPQGPDETAAVTRLDGRTVSFLQSPHPTTAETKLSKTSASTCGPLSPIVASQSVPPAPRA